MRHRTIAAALAGLLALSLLTACQPQGTQGSAAPTTSPAVETGLSKQSRVGFFCDTVITIEAYTNDESILDDAIAECQRYDDLLSKTKEGSDVWKINHANGERVAVSQETLDIIRKALARSGFDYVPVISFNLSLTETNPGFSLTLPIIRRMLAGVIYGDMIMLLSNQTRPYEIEAGKTDQLVGLWVDNISKQFRASRGYTLREMRENFKNIIRSFAAIPRRKEKMVRVGVVGEIYVKYASFANNGLEKFLAEQGCEVMVPGLLGFLMFKVDARIQDFLIYGGSRVKYLVATKLLNYLEKIEQVFMESVEKFSDFMQLSAYQDTKEPMKGLIGLGNRMGEGWFLPAEMVELIVHGYENIICTQPFGCLPTHVCGKGMIHKIKDRYPGANIVPVDYDPGATRVNQENRIKLMLAVAKEKLCEA